MCFVDMCDISQRDLVAAVAPPKHSHIWLCLYKRIVVLDTVYRVLVVSIIYSGTGNSLSIMYEKKREYHPR